MAINLRSPYYTGTAIEYTVYATLDISIWNGSVTSAVAAQYNLRKSVVGTSTSVFFEISELVRDYLDITFDGGYTGQNVWVKTVQKAYNSANAVLATIPITNIAYDSYSYFEEPNFDINLLPILITNREIFALEDNVFRIPINTSYSPSIVFYKDGEVIASQSFNASSDSSGQIKYVSIYGDSVNWDTFQERVTDDGGKYELNACLQSFFDNYSIGAVDKITVSANGKIETIKVNVIEECKYEPKKVTFINRFGALQDMYFFKKSVEKMVVEKESYKSNIISSFGIYDTYNHVNKDFNVIGKESITLSSGFLSEEYNEVFKQMMLSEKVWVTNILETGEQVVPINVKTSEITYKTSLNNKLVEYTIEFDKSFDTINNIR
jgi:hypothetical protein